MRKLFAACALAASLLISACATTSSSDQTAIVQEVKDIASKVCSFLPTATTVLNIINLGDPTLSNAQSIAQAICDVVDAKSVRAGAPLRVKGVRVHGHKIPR